MKRTPLKRSKPFRPTGKTTQGWRKTSNRPGWAKARAAVHARSGGRCEVQVARNCYGHGTSAHHVVLRSRGGSDDPSNLLWICPPCHGWVHGNPAKATERGWMKSKGAS